MFSLAFIHQSKPAIEKLDLADGVLIVTPPRVARPSDGGSDEQADGGNSEEDGEIERADVLDRQGEEDGVADGGHEGPEHEDDTAALVPVPQEGRWG